MKTLTIIITLALSSFAFGQTKKVETATILTSAECGDCKERIEEVLNYTNGIQFAELDVPSKVVTVKFKTKKISLEEIRTIISEIGYDADDVKANAEKQKALPMCCQPGGMHK